MEDMDTRVEQYALERRRWCQVMLWLTTSVTCLALVLFAVYAIQNVHTSGSKTSMLLIGAVLPVETPITNTEHTQDNPEHLNSRPADNEGPLEQQNRKDQSSSPPSNKPEDISLWEKVLEAISVYPLRWKKSSDHAWKILHSKDTHPLIRKMLLKANCGDNTEQSGSVERSKRSADVAGSSISKSLTKSATEKSLEPHINKEKLETAKPKMPAMGTDPHVPAVGKPKVSTGGGKSQLTAQLANKTHTNEKKAEEDKRKWSQYYGPVPLTSGKDSNVSALAEHIEDFTDVDRLQLLKTIGISAAVAIIVIALLVYLFLLVGAYKDFYSDSSRAQRQVYQYQYQPLHQEGKITEQAL